MYVIKLHVDGSIRVDGYIFEGSIFQKAMRVVLSAELCFSIIVKINMPSTLCCYVNTRHTICSHVVRGSSRCTLEHHGNLFISVVFSERVETM